MPITDDVTVAACMESESFDFRFRFQVKHIVAISPAPRVSPRVNEQRYLISPRPCMSLPSSVHMLDKLKQI